MLRRYRFELIPDPANYMRSGCNPFFPLLIIYPAFAFCCFYQLFIKMNTVRLSLTRSPLPIIL